MAPELYGGSAGPGSLLWLLILSTVWLAVGNSLGATAGLVVLVTVFVPAFTLCRKSWAGLRRGG